MVPQPVRSGTGGRAPGWFQDLVRASEEVPPGDPRGLRFLSASLPGVLPTGLLAKNAHTHSLNKYKGSVY